LFESRIMTAAHVAALFFDGHHEATKKRLQKIKAAGLIGERTRRVFEPSILFLARKGFMLLQEQGTLKDYPRVALPALAGRARVSEITLQHELEIMDVKASLYAALTKTKRFSLAEFFHLASALSVRKPFGLDTTEGEVIVKPDGFIRIHEAEADGGLSEHTFFLEVDRSSETLDTLVAKAGCYLEYFKSGGFADATARRAPTFKEYPVPVLMVCKSAERRKQTRRNGCFKATRQFFPKSVSPPLEEVTTDPLGTVWILPLGYRDATKGTAFDPSRKREQWGYQRQTRARCLLKKR